MKCLELLFIERFHSTKSGLLLAAEALAPRMKGASRYIHESINDVIARSLRVNREQWQRQTIVIGTRSRRKTRARLRVLINSV